MLKKITIIGVILSLLAAILFGIISPIYGEYSGVNIRGAIDRYIESNDGKWPKSWEDIEPYHHDVFGFSTTVFAKIHWNVHWDVDINKARLFTEILNQNDSNSDTLGTPIIYQRRDVEDPSLVTDWYFTNHPLPIEIEQ